mgnify:CR=1 FL=1
MVSFAQNAKINEMLPVKKNLKYEKIVNLKGLNEATLLVIEWIVSDKKRAGAAVVGLYGNLGSGKTAFVKKIGKILGINGKIISPTFIIMKRYAIPSPRRKKFNLNEIIHIDAYRLGGHEEILKLNWPEIIKNKKQAVFIEWPERVKKAMPKNALKVKFSFVNEKKRKVKISP